MSLMAISKRYSTVEACLARIEKVRWDGKPYCPYCGGCRKIYRYSDDLRHRCADCKRVFRVTTGTVFSNTPLKLLPKWFMAIWLVTEHPKGISSVQLARDIEVTQKTAWHMLHRIQHASSIVDDGEILTGEVKVGEAYIGGKEKNKHASKRTPRNQGRSVKTKTVVVGMRERGGKTRAFQVPTSSSRDIVPTVVRNVAIGTYLSADTYPVYNALGAFYKMGRVNHSAGEYRKGKASTNAIESLWALVKRTYIGTHHWWSHEHTQRYVNACAFRLNIDRGARVGAMLPYKVLTG